MAGAPAPRPAPRPTGVAILVVVGVVIAGAAFVVGRASRHPSPRAPRVATPVPTRSVPTTSVPTTAVPTTATPSSTAAPSAPYGPAGAFAALWQVHGHSLAIDPTGYAILDWRTYNTCGQDPPPCDIFSGNAIIDGGHATLAFTASSATEASVEVLTTTDPSEVPLGGFTARLDPARDLLNVSVPLFAQYPLCGPAALAMPVQQQQAAGINCGA